MDRASELGAVVGADKHGGSIVSGGRQRRGVSGAGMRDVAA